MEKVVGPWVLMGSSTALEVQDHKEAGLKHSEIHGCGKFHDLEGPVHGVRDPKEEWSRDILFKLIMAQKTFLPVSCGLVWRMLPPSPGGYISSTDKYFRRRQRKRRPGDGGTPQQALPYSKRQRSIDGNFVLM